MACRKGTFQRILKELFKATIDHHSSTTILHEQVLHYILLGMHFKEFIIKFASKKNSGYVKWQYTI